MRPMRGHLSRIFGARGMLPNGHSAANVRGGTEGQRPCTLRGRNAFLVGDKILTLVGTQRAWAAKKPYIQGQGEGFFEKTTVGICRVLEESMG